MRITVNGQSHTVETPSGPTLLDVLREDLHLTGTKYGCGEGECGACTVLVDGAPTRACTQDAASVAGPVTTVEGLAATGNLHRVQAAFVGPGPCSAVTAPRAWSCPRWRCCERDPSARRGRDPRRAGRQHLPLRRLSADRGGVRRPHRRVSSMPPASPLTRDDGAEPCPTNWSWTGSCDRSTRPQPRGDWGWSTPGGVWLTSTTAAGSSRTRQGRRRPGQPGGAEPADRGRAGPSTCPVRLEMGDTTPHR